MRSETTIQKWGTYRQAEELSGLSRTTLWRLVKMGEVEAAKVGRAVRINPPEPRRLYEPLLGQRLR